MRRRRRRRRTAGERVEDEGNGSFESIELEKMAVDNSAEQRALSISCAQFQTRLTNSQETRHVNGSFSVQVHCIPEESNPESKLDIWDGSESQSESK